MNSVRLEPAAIEQLGRAIRGSVIVPAADYYDQARQSFNGMIDRRPSAIVQPLDAAEAALALRFAADRGVSIAVRGGGHSVAGHGLIDDGVVIDLRRMRAVRVDPARKRAAAHGGALWED